MSDLKIGCHLSCAKGYEAMGKQALSLGANVFQFFSRNPRGTKAKAVSEKDVDALKQLAKEHNFGKLLIHAPYTINLCSNDIGIAEITEKMIAEDLQTLEKYLPHNLYNVHPGCKKDLSLSEAINCAAKIINNVIDFSPNTTFLLETMSGKGSEIGKTFEELKMLMSAIEHNDNVGVCLDTCHVFAAGYDIVNHLDDVLEQFDKVIGLSKLHAIHLNDSMTPFDSRKDRHAPIGAGTIGTDAIARIINHKHLREIPFYLETPDDNSGQAHALEIKLIKSLYK